MKLIFYNVYCIFPVIPGDIVAWGVEGPHARLNMHDIRFHMCVCVCVCVRVRLCVCERE